MRGNARVREGQARHANLDDSRRKLLVQGQDPRVIVLSCSDSRVPIEHVFDIGFGDAFVIRTAGHILDSAVLASLDYALAALKPNLLVVMGHQSCGAVGAAAAFIEGEIELPTGFQRPIMEKVGASALVSKQQGKTTREDFERQHTIETVNLVVNELQNAQNLIEQGTFGVVGARYILEDGSVETVITRGLEG